MNNRPPKGPTKRQCELARMRSAGYHDDARERVLGLVERRTAGRAALDEAWAQGSRMRAAGVVRCDCWRCKREQGQGVAS